jgi:hypothetical protein
MRITPNTSGHDNKQRSMMPRQAGKHSVIAHALASLLPPCQSPSLPCHCADGGPRIWRGSCRRLDDVPPQSLLEHDIDYWKSLTTPSDIPTLDVRNYSARCTSSSILVFFLFVTFLLFEEGKSHAQKELRGIALGHLSWKIMNYKPYRGKAVR